MVDTPTMSLRVPHDADMRKALREAARALRQGQIAAEALLAWLASRPAHDQGLTERVAAIEERLTTLEATAERLAPTKARGLLCQVVKAE